MLSVNEGREYCMNCGHIQSIPGHSKCDVCGNGDLGIVVTPKLIKTFEIIWSVKEWETPVLMRVTANVLQTATCKGISLANPLQP